MPINDLLSGFLRGRQMGSTPEPPSGGMSIPIGGLPPNVTAGLRGAVTGPLHALGGLFGGGGSGLLSPTLFDLLRNALMKQVDQGASPSMPPPSPAQPMPPAWSGIAEGEPPPGTGLPGGQQQFPGLNEGRNWWDVPGQPRTRFPPPDHKPFPRGPIFQPRPSPYPRGPWEDHKPFPPGQFPQPGPGPVGTISPYPRKIRTR